MRRIIRLLLVMGIIITICTISSNAAEDVHNVDTKSLLLMDDNGVLWYEPEGIPLTFISEDLYDIICDYELYNMSTRQLSDLRTNEEIVWDYWYYKIGNPYGVAGLLGNMQAESGVQASCVQKAKSHGLSDEEYTSRVDNGTYKNFINDGAGYGLVQWTYSAYKSALLDYAKNNHASVGDIYIQCDFLYHQLTSDNFHNVYKTLSSAKNIKTASDSVMINFERPANQSFSAKQRRASLGEEVYNRCYKRGSVLNDIMDDINNMILGYEYQMRFSELQTHLTEMQTRIQSKFLATQSGSIHQVLTGLMYNNEKSVRLRRTLFI